MPLTLEKLQEFLPDTNGLDEWFALFDSILPTAEINSDLRIAAFLSQCAHESANFTVLRENLNYSSDALVKLFPKYFPNADMAAAYHRRPEQIANHMYANRMGNGSEESEDGFKYRGRGLIQITGRTNYTNCSTALFNDDRFVTNPDLLLGKEGAVQSACWYWGIRSLNSLADAGNIKEITRKINGGYIGLDDRTEKYNRILPILEA